ncbi:MAG: ThiF family adenylyltransferase [Magnetococcus sp. MYC-9]
MIFPPEQPVRPNAPEDAWLERYSRQLLLNEVGGAGQLRLGQAVVGILGAGAMANPLTLYLAAAGIGHLEVVDSEQAAPLCATVRTLNPLVQLTPRPSPLSQEEAAAQMRPWHLALLTDEPILPNDSTSRLWFNRAALQAGKTLLAGWQSGKFCRMAISRAGQDPHAPCLQCAETGTHALQTCSAPSTTLLHMATGLIGSILAMEAIRFLLDNRSATCYDGLIFYPAEGRYESVPVQKDPNCPACCGNHHG